MPALTASFEASQGDPTTMRDSFHLPNRRRFLGGLCGSTLAAAWPGLKTTPAAPLGGKPRVALVITEYRGYSHADVIAGRLLQGHILGPGETYWPRTQVVSMYVDQFPESDLSRGMAKQYGARIAPTIEDALTLDNELAVDGVVIIGEHGDYPMNEKGQHMYPRRRFFEQVVRAFEKTGTAVPVFNDKHLGYAWEDAKWMYDQSRRLSFPLMAGSSLPTTWRKPDLELPLDVELSEGLAIGYGGTEAYGFHALETLQCMIERRRGGESGVRRVTCLEGDAVWEAGEAGKWSRDLLAAAVACVAEKPSGRPEDHCTNPTLFLLEHTDGFRSSVIMLNGYTTAFGFAGLERARRDASSSPVLAPGARVRPLLVPHAQHRGHDSREAGDLSAGADAAHHGRPRRGHDVASRRPSAGRDALARKRGVSPARQTRTPSPVLRLTWCFSN